MNCREFVDFLLGYIENELPDAQAHAFRQHMSDCPPCVTYLDTYRETVRLGGEVCADPEGAIPEDVPEQLVQAVLAARRADTH
jgi:anti-sigma factor RsiW